MKNIDRIEGELDGLGAGIGLMEIMLTDPDFDPMAADLARFYKARLERRQRELLRAADLATIEAEEEEADTGDVNDGE